MSTNRNPQWTVSTYVCVSWISDKHDVINRHFICVLISSQHAGVAVLVSPDIPLQLGVDSRQQFCLQSLPNMERLPLQYSVCVSHNVKAAHQEAVQLLTQHNRELPNMKTLWLVHFSCSLCGFPDRWIILRGAIRPVSVCGFNEALADIGDSWSHKLKSIQASSEQVWSLCVFCRLPFWKLLTNVDSGPKVERELRTFSNRLRRHQLGEGVISLNEHSTNLLSDMVCAPLGSLNYSASITRTFASLGQS